MNAFLRRVFRAFCSRNFNLLQFSKLHSVFQEESNHTTLFQQIPYFEVLFHFISKTPPHPPSHLRTGNLGIPCFGSKFSSAALRAAKISIFERFRQIYGLYFRTLNVSRAMQRLSWIRRPKFLTKFQFANGIRVRYHL